MHLSSKLLQCKQSDYIYRYCTDDFNGNNSFFVISIN